MATARSFQEYVKSKCYNRLYHAVENHVSDNWDSLNLYTRKVRKIGSVELIDVTIQRVYIEDMPGMMVGFDVCMELELCVREGDYHYDETDVCYPWVRLRCAGDLSCGLDGFTIRNIGPYSKKNAPLNSLSDALVPNIKYDQLEKIASDFLSAYYPEALQVTRYGDKPVPVDPVTLAKNLGFAIMRHNIREDGSVYGQIYFADSDVELFDEMSGDTVTVHVPKNTIVIDPKTCLFRNIGCENNSIVHECVHGVKHRKVFELERLYNASAYNISCEVVGGAESSVLRNATETMEKQANQLAPRIQMPEGPFRAKASEYIGRFMREKNSDRPNEVMEAVIIQLQSDFLVSRQAAKIRMVELGFEEAIGTFTYLDEHYVKPHCFRKGSIKWNQTFSISAQDAAIERFINPELRELTKNGDYLFVDNHYVYNAPLYVRKDEFGGLELTEYSLSHMDECCLVFDMKIIGGIETDYHTACYLNRDRSNVTFEVKFHNGFENSPQPRQIAMRKKQAEEEMGIRKQMTDDPAQCLELLLRWRKKKYTELADYIDISPKTLSRVVNGENVPEFKTAIMICFGLNLPPLISGKFLSVCNCSLLPTNPQHQWIREALYIKYPESIENICRYLHMYGVTILPIKKILEKRTSNVRLPEYSSRCR